MLDITLEEPDKDLILYHRANYHITSDPDYMAESRYDQQVHDIREHGFNSIYLRATDTTYFDKIAAEGFSELAISQVRDVSKLDAMLGYGMEPFFYGIDEPNSLAKIQNQIDRSKEIHSLCSGQDCGRVITAITKEWADRLWDPNDPIYEGGEYEPLDYANLNVTASEEYIGARRRGERDGIALKEYRQAYYWQIRREDPRVNRYYAGFHLWLTDLDGIYPYVYQSNYSNPYDDFDIAEGTLYNVAERVAHVAYPSQQGPVCTMEWEALREGIDDYRYLQTWDGLRQQVELIDPIESARSVATIEAILEKYRATDTLETVDIAAYDADRQLIQAEILALKAVLEVTIDVASGEQSSVSVIEIGSYVDTHQADWVSEQVTEVIGGGRNARSRFEHRWSFDVTGADPVEFHMLAQVVNPDLDAFEITYSIDGGSSWSAVLFTIHSTTRTAYTAPLPTGTSGAILIRARDNNWDKRETNPTGLAIDHMYIRSERPVPCTAPPIADFDPQAQILLNVSDPVVFRDQSSNAPSSWSWDFGDGTVSSERDSSHTYSDPGLYSVSLTATNDCGSDTETKVDLADVAASSGGITVTATGYAMKRNRVYLRWSGAVGSDVDIYRGGSLLTTTANDGAYTDATNTRGSQTFEYQVCEAASSTCSPSVTVIF